MFYYKNCFKAMEEAEILDMDDPFMRVIHIKVKAC
jgi:hypothetical protein